MGKRRRVLTSITVDPELFKAAKVKGLSLGSLLDSAIASVLTPLDASTVFRPVVSESKPHISESKPILVKSGFNLAQYRANKPKTDLLADLQNKHSDLDWQPDNPVRAAAVKERICNGCSELVSCVVPCAKFQEDYVGTQ